MTTDDCVFVQSKLVLEGIYPDPPRLRDAETGEIATRYQIEEAGAGAVALAIEIGQLPEPPTRTWAIKVRTSPGAPMTAQFECPYHGRFEATVQRDAAGDPPASFPCPGAWADEHDEVQCGEPAEWRISAPGVHTQFVVSATQGKPAPKPHPYSMDHRKLAEGRRNDYKAERKKIREELRRQRVQEFIK